MNRPELLSPAGSLKHMRYAYAYGADAVYAGQPRYSLRVRNNSFDFDALKQGIFEAHENDKKFFVASNIIPHNAKIKTYMKDIEPVIELNPDALIMADPGLIMMVKEKFPQQVIHLSVQANTINYATVKFWKNAGISRIILSRELSLDEVKEIRQECPDIELEVFVHGALCIAYSGRCLLSGYFNHRDPNQGSCTNSCRWKYDVKEAEETIEGDIKAVEIKAPIDQVVLLEEEGRPGEQMPAYEDEHGTYIMNSKDLRAIEHVHTLTAMGIDSLKIEGRTKSHYYAARTAQVYRKAIDDAVAGKKFDPEAFGVLENLANRGYTDGFYRRHQPEELQTYFDNYSRSHQQQVVGEILDYKDGKAFIEAKNKFSVGDSIEVILPSGCFNTKVESMVTEYNEELDVAKGSGYRVWIPMTKIDPNLGFIAKNFDEKIKIKNKNIQKDPEQKIRRPSW
ncbi:tRNA 5-hydroxyuridine modification protein YegQ [Candidatus Thioglobus sp.]|jgi:putative protease|uniref:prephenate-dependent tRNA uridine(34) hydroxylase TrhP n=1 Tax=Candidatus Thioglobus sp. TaxID=2026721 RepID=UPI001EB3F04E|nr:tRNA 5-hydroxyuridine modification protein YegQ [Candidatus Thioglobus sp.]MBT3186928.1 tRNA 5-hydroxyuridine modification protein YegQ [Candidatus Thioglobus sp.]MBT4923420.1 tRNA 5-hydroxyuridine modification protein YegQ [Candidatus Thioglobus sp.]MBT6327366.1 tRNA 5-hydroxyuridine modification protein YegQ [Candidatus Thioglobus sp.]MBT7498428.1 tRNA 5-hydroxyuridine modification protein YegQ [Candidatus Thioglobus sp.]